MTLEALPDLARATLNVAEARERRRAPQSRLSGDDWRAR